MSKAKQNNLEKYKQVSEDFLKNEGIKIDGGYLKLPTEKGTIYALNAETLLAKYTSYLRKRSFIKW